MVDAIESQENPPGWWPRWVKEALPFVSRDHSLGETILGIGKLIEEGQTEEAKRLSLQATTQIDLLRRNPEMEGEIGSSQLATLMADESYPLSLKELICQKVPEMRAYLPAKKE